MENESHAHIGKMLVDAKVITLDQLEIALREQRKTGELLCTCIIRLGFASEEGVFNVLSKRMGVKYVRIKNISIKPEIIAKVPAKFASHYKLIPIDVKGNELTIVVSDPLDFHTLDDVRLLLGFKVKALLGYEKDILEGIYRYYGVGAETLETIVSEVGIKKDKEGFLDKVEDLELAKDDASIVKFVNQILTQAVKDRATDIHIEPSESDITVRFRVDGILYKAKIPPTIRHFYSAIVSRIKIMAELNIAERRLPQDGRFKIKVGDAELDLRVSIVPSGFGESTHIRILSSKYLLDLESLGLYDEDLKKINSVIKRPHGIIFVTGPTGSGKTTTLYASLSKINSSEIKIITIEDPIEYQLPGIIQMQTRSKIGLSFANGLRHMLRHDPDVMMVGEVRDYETAEISIRAALTGHLVFSTLHTNDAAGAITRLLDMGVEPFLVSSSIECVIAQRLVRLICPRCKTKVKAPHDLPSDIKLDKDVIFEGKGCEACKFTGFRGRTAIYEILIMNQALREMVTEHASSNKIKQKAISLGMRTLRQSGIEKVRLGLTTISEVLRVTQKET